MIKIFLITLLFSACKMSPPKEAEAPSAGETLQGVAPLTMAEYSLAKSLCESLSQKRSLFRSLHDGKSFDFQLENTQCGKKIGETTVAASLNAPMGQEMNYVAAAGSQLYFSDVVTSTDGITRFLCEKISRSNGLDNTISISESEKLQFRFGGTAETEVIIEVKDFIADKSGQFVLKEIQAIRFHTKPPTLSDFSGLEIARSISKKCDSDGRLSTILVQKNLQSLP
jgi:hypothetical protein